MNVLHFDSDNCWKCDSGGAAPACHLAVLSQPSGQEGPAQVLQGYYYFLPHLIKSISLFIFTTPKKFGEHLYADDVSQISE